jgi:isoquinoline 1-oxidoreductase subunit alpha
MRELQAMPHAIYVSDVRGSVDVDGDTPPLWVLRDVLGMTGTKFGSGMALWRVHGASGWKPDLVVREAGGQHPVIRHHHHRGNLKDPAGRKIQEAWLNLEEQRNERVSVVGRAVQRT